ncbi:hypothetical protein B0H14DRAFT_2570658 [Mycena olivaceomarginata]|nr:hypothetical protein B0H14DRAFT_2570658 [Mycena olivaceomarginata]
MKSGNSERVQRASFLRSSHSTAGLLDSGGYLNTQTSDTQYFGLMGSQATGMRPLEPLEDREDNDYVDETGSGFGSIFRVANIFRSSKNLGTCAISHRPLSLVMRQKLGDPLTEEEKKVSEDFVVACQRLAMSGNRDPLRQPNALEIELAAVLTRIAQSVPLITRLSMEGRWNETMAVVEDARRNLSLLDLVHCIGRIVEDEVNPEITSEEVIARNYTQEWVAANN